MLKRVILNREPADTIIEVGSITDYKQVIAWNGSHVGVILYDNFTERFYIKWAGNASGNTSDSNKGWRDLIMDLLTRPKLLAEQFSIQFYTIQ